jgi:hypothetical protein
VGRSCPWFGRGEKDSICAVRVLGQHLKFLVQLKHLEQNTSLSWSPLVQDLGEMALVVGTSHYWGEKEKVMEPN